MAVRATSVTIVLPAEVQESAEARARREEMDALFAEVGSFTPEGILTLTQARMDDLDLQLQGNMKALNDRMAMSDALSRKIQALQAIQQQLQGQVDDDGNINLSEVNLEIEAPAAGLVRNPDGSIPEAPPPEPSSRPAAGERPSATISVSRVFETETEAKLTTLGLEGIIYSDEDANQKIMMSRVTSELDRLQTEQREVNSGNDMLMLQIQSLTQKRSQLLQLGTSLIGKLNESANAIAQNIGR